MTIQNVINTIQNNVLPNVTTNRQMKTESIIELINEGLNTFHSLFRINTEQAIILVPAFRHNFKLINEDPNVIMASRYKLAECELKTDNLETKTQQIQALLEFDKKLKEQILLNNEKENKEIFSTKKDQVLQILEVTDEKNTIYSFNEENMFIIDQITLYFPNCKEGDIIYVIYKTKPQLINKDSLNEEIDLPDSLLECLYAFVTLRVISGIQGYQQFYPNVLNTYNQKIQEAIANQYVLPSSLATTLPQQKGFF
jgi:hypothetical protein